MRTDTLFASAPSFALPRLAPDIPVRLHVADQLALQAEVALLLLSFNSYTCDAESVCTISHRCPAANAGIVTIALRPVESPAASVSLNVTVASRSPVVASALVARYTRSENGPVIALSPPLVSVQVTITWSPALAVPDPMATFETWRSGYCASVDVTDQVIQR